MVSENTIRDEQYRGAQYQLTKILDTIAMTKDQRRSIDSYLDDMDGAFTNANKNPEV